MSTDDDWSVPAWEGALDRAVLALGRTPWGISGGGHAHGLLRVFPPVQRRLEKGHDIRLIRPGGYLRYEVGRFPAEPLDLGNGIRLRRADPVIIIHFDNRVLSGMRRELTSRRALAWWMYRTAVMEFHHLAALIRSGEISENIRAVWAETFMYTVLARMGLCTRPAPATLRTPFARLYSLALMAIYGSLELTAANVRQHRLGEAWLGRDEFLDRFGAAPSGNSDSRLGGV